MDIETVIEVVKRWVEDETGPGFGYHINHCDDLTNYYNMLRDMLKDAEKNGLKERTVETETEFEENNLDVDEESDKLD